MMLSYHTVPSGQLRGHISVSVPRHASRDSSSKLKCSNERRTDLNLDIRRDVKNEDGIEVGRSILTNYSQRSPQTRRTLER